MAEFPFDCVELTFLSDMFGEKGAHATKWVRDKYGKPLSISIEIDGVSAEFTGGVRDCTQYTNAWGYPSHQTLKISARKKEEI